eukprot:COSAG06_NODE_1063_length_10870_cov_236.460217_8_plen_130_part_00
MSRVHDIILVLAIMPLRLLRLRQRCCTCCYSPIVCTAIVIFHVERVCPSKMCVLASSSVRQLCVRRHLFSVFVMMMPIVPLRVAATICRRCRGCFSGSLRRREQLTRYLTGGFSSYSCITCSHSCCRHG